MDDREKPAAFSFFWEGIAKKNRHEYPAARGLFEQALIAGREHDFPYRNGFVALTLKQLGLVAESVQDHAAAQKVLRGDRKAPPENCGK